MTLSVPGVRGHDYALPNSLNIKSTLLAPPLLLHLHRILHQRHLMRHHRIIPRTPALPALGNTAAAPTVISIGVLGGLVQGFDF